MDVAAATASVPPLGTIDDLAEQVAGLFLDLPAFASFLEIKTKEDGFVDFGGYPDEHGATRWHPEQWRFETERTGRDIVLKPRQIGFSTIELARDVQYAITHPGSQVLVVVHTGEVKTELFDAAHLMVKSLMRWGLLAKPRQNTQTSLRLTNGSSIRVIEAGRDEKTASNRGRSGTVHRLHLTECAHYGAPKETITALFGAVPRGGEIVIESTANGVGNWFHGHVQLAREKQFDDFRYHFFAWFDHAEYREPVESAPNEPATARERHWERRLRALGCDDEQIAWWRKAVSRLGLDKALQEFPPSSDAAFDASGDTWIEPEHLDWLEAGIRPPIEERVIARDDQRFGKLRIWQLPQRGASYVIGSDVGQGIGRDASTLYVIDHRTADVCAAWHSNRVKPGDLGHVLAFAGRLYNTALIAVEVERQGGGRTALEILDRIERYPISRVYHRDSKSDPYAGTPKAGKRGETHKKPGWASNATTRPVLWGDLAKAIEDHEASTPDEKTVAETRTLVVDAEGKPAARGKGKRKGADDGSFVAWAIARQVRQRVPMPGGGVVAKNVGRALVSTGIRT